MQTFITPFVDYTHSQVEAFAQFRSHFAQPDAMAQLVKANFENYSRFLQDYTRSLAAFAFDTRGQIARSIEAGAAAVAGQTAANKIVVAETVGSVAEAVQEKRA